MTPITITIQSKEKIKLAIPARSTMTVDVTRKDRVTLVVGSRTTSGVLKL